MNTLYPEEDVLIHVVERLENEERLNFLVPFLAVRFKYQFLPSTFASRAILITADGVPGDDYFYWQKRSNCRLLLYVSLIR